jgi:hypothetical protein
VAIAPVSVAIVRGRSRDCSGTRAAKRRLVTHFPTIDADQLATATGGIFYDEHKSPTGERWAASFDAGAKRFYDTVSPYAGRNVTGLAMLPALAVGEVAARTAGRAWDAVTGSQP